MIFVHRSSGRSFSRPTGRDRHQQRGGLPVHGELGDGDRVGNRLDRPAQVQRPDDDRPAAGAALEQPAHAGHEDGQPQTGTGRVGVEGTELDGVLAGSGVAVADELLGPSVEVLLAHLDALPEGGRHGVIENLRAAAGAGRDLDAVESRAGLAPAGADGPDLAGRERVAVDGFVAVQLRRGDELLDAVDAQREGEVRIAELALQAALLLLLHAPARLQRQPHDPFEVFVRYPLFRIGEEQLHEAGTGLVHGLHVAPAQGAAPEHPVLEHRDPARPPQARPAFAEEVAHQPEAVGQVIGGVQLREVPARRVGVDAVVERRVVAHLPGQRAQEMADPLLLLDVDLEVADHDDAALGADALLAAAELAGGHIALHDVDAVLLVERDAGDLVEADHVVLADQAALPVGHVHEHLGDGGLAARQQVRIRGELLVDVALAGAARAELDQVVVALDERGHAQQHDASGRLVQGGRLQAGGADEEVAPIRRRESAAPPGQHVEHVGLRHLDGTQLREAEGAAGSVLRLDGIVAERHLGVEPVAQHALVVLDDGVRHLHVVQVQARQLGDVAVVLRVQLRADDVDQLDRPVLAGARLEDLLIAGPHRPAPELPLDDGQPLLDLPVVDAGAVAPQQELDHVGRDRVLPRVAPHQVLAHQVAGEGVRGQRVQAIHRDRLVHVSTPTRTGEPAGRWPPA